MTTGWAARAGSVAAAAAALCFLDPRWWQAGRLAVVGVVAAATLVAWRQRFSSRIGAALLAFAWLTVTAAAVDPVFRGDGPSYYVYLRSLAFDHDLDFANEWQRWGYSPLEKTPTGLLGNYHTIGPAILWSPFFLAGHAYVRVVRFFGDGTWAADGMSTPYFRAAALGTIAWTVAGAWALVCALRRVASPQVALVAAVVTFLATPWVYYALRFPWVGHSLACSLACIALLAWLRAEAGSSSRSWIALGACVGVLALCRPQSLVASFAFVGPLAAAQLLRRRVGLVPLALAMLTALAAFAPQMLVWKALYGRALTLPMGGAFMDFRSPNLVNVLLSADRGFFSWTPLAALAVVGLLAVPRERRLLAASIALTLVTSAWINGAVLGVHGPEWAGADAFGARRFDMVFPLLAVGIAAFAEWLSARPLVAVAAGLGLFAVWNVGLATVYESRALPDGPAPLEQVAAAQARLARGFAERALTAIAGPPGRALAYKVFVGQYLYYDLALDGTIDLGSEASARFLEGVNWSPPRKRGDIHAFRWALHPQACLRLPLERAIDLRSRLLVRRAPGSGARNLGVVANGRPAFKGGLGHGWGELAFVLPAAALRAGENRICFAFDGGKAGEAAAAIAWLQLP